MHIGEFTFHFLERVQQILQHKLIFLQVVFLGIFQAREVAGDPNNTKVIEENERVKDVFLEIFL